LTCPSLSLLDKSGFSSLSAPIQSRWTGDQLEASLSRYVHGSSQHHLETATGRGVSSRSGASQAGKAEHTSRCERAWGAAE
ncbi:hypothetical protein D4764_16G0004620, partial [Takifugu flavidus]